MTDNPPRREYAGVVTVAQFVDLVRRDGTGLTRAEAVRKSGLAKSTFYDILRDADNVRVRTIESFCNAYGVDIVIGIRKKS